MRSAASVVALVALASAPARAEDIAQPPPPFERSGFVIGAAAGWGAYRAAGYTPTSIGGGFSGHLGAVLRDDVTLLGEVGMVAPRDDDGNGRSLGLMLGFSLLARWFPARSVWVEGGVGGARLDVDDGSEYGKTLTGAMVSLAGAYEIYQGESFCLDVHARVQGGRFSRGATEVDAWAATAQLGFTWY